MFSSANMVSILISGLLLQFKSDKLERYSSATRCSPSLTAMPLFDVAGGKRCLAVLIKSMLSKSVTRRKHSRSFYSNQCLLLFSLFHPLFRSLSIVTFFWQKLKFSNDDYCCICTIMISPTHTVSNSPKMQINNRKILDITIIRGNYSNICQINEVYNFLKK